MGTRTWPKSIAIGLLFGCLGFAGNWLRLELFFNVDFLFGSIFAIFALLLFGPLAGIIAGLLAATCTWFLWNHPWAIIIFGSEAVFLAWQGGRRDRDLLTADFLFWLLIGGPLIWIFYHAVMAVPLQPTVLIVLKQSLNGILNTLLATLAYFLLSACRRPDERLPSFRQLVFLAFVSLVVLPAITYLIWNLRRTLEHERAELAATVARLDNSVAQLVRQYLEEKVRTVWTVALLTGDPQQVEPRILQAQIETIRSASPDLHRMAVFNADAVVVARVPRDEEGTSAIGSRVAGAAYLPELQTRKRPLVTDTFLGRIGEPVPLVAVVVPILRHDAMLGFCTGILDESRLRMAFETIINGRQLHFTLLDRQRRVVVSTRDDLPMMSAYARPEGLISAAENGVQHWVPQPEERTSIMQRWRKSYFFKENRVSEDFPWTVVVEGSAAPMMERLTRETIATLAQMLLLVIGTIALSHLLSRGFLQTLKALEAASKELPQRLRDREEIVWPRSGIRELDSLSRNFQQTGSALRTSFASLQALNESLERRVAERTEALHYLSLHDDLTGLFNRRALDQAMEREWRRATRLPHPFSVLLLDIDHFKRYNDTWGHLQGDVCLKEIAAVIQRAVFRADDLAARYGGEEFAVLLPTTSADDAVQIAERIRLAVTAREIGHPDGMTRSQVTISIGIATTLPARDIPPTLPFQMADQALYAAKSAGRNCVVLHPESFRATG